MKKLFKILIFSIVAIATVFLCCFLFKSDSCYKSVEVNGKKMGAHIKGSGSKTVVMLSDWAVDSPIDDFYPIWRDLGKDYKVVVLEYLGYSGSDTTEEERTNEKMVEEIRAALQKLGIKPPYILMPHGMSGLYSLYYANKYPSEISGIIGIEMFLPQKQLEYWSEESFEKTKSENSTRSLNKSLINQWNSFYENSKELENTKYPTNLPVLAFLSTEQISTVNEMIASGEMKISWPEINKNVITNSEIQEIKVLEGKYDLMYDQYDAITKTTKKFIENIKEKTYD